MQFGLIGKSLKHSFSKKYFEEKFKREGLGHSYSEFEIDDIRKLKEILKNNPDLKGLNVTIPYKEDIIPLLDSISEEAASIGAVNTILVKENHLHGFNTDVYGFEKSLLPLLKPHHTKALILGTGGASKAVGFVLDKLGIDFKNVSRNPKADEVNYGDSEPLIKDHYLVINTTPLGTFPNISEYPPISFHSVDENHLFYDLIYNPEVTYFLKEAKQKGAAIKNGLEMLHIQADEAWNIWNKY